MKNQLYFKIYNKISSVLTDRVFLKDNDLEEDFILKGLGNASFKLTLESIINENDYSCNKILKLCDYFLNDINNNLTHKEWLNYIYQYNLNMSFPHATQLEFNKDLNKGTIIYLNVLRIFSHIERKKDDINNVKYPLRLLTKQEEKQYRVSLEYKRFKKIFYDLFVYELMKLNREVTGHNTIDHISGVHLVALYIGKQLYNAGLPVDLGWVSGAGAGHDIGKYGCSGEELKRVAYLHYYYTEQWFKENNIPYIGHIATNHSTWDLELENLPIESLILIYADFRVKNRETPKGEREMHIFSLEESFDIILKKLDNVDEAKEKRYKRVYSKLLDFQNYMKNLGINLDPFNTTTEKKPKEHYALMKDKEIINNIKYVSIDHNIHLMNMLRNEASLSSILELARSENDWKRLRAYLNIFEKYSTYLTRRQKIITLNFLYENLIHKEEDIRKQCAELMGNLIATFDEEYRKEIPKNAKPKDSEIDSYDLLDKYIGLLLYPDHKMIDIHKEWIGYSLRIMISSLCKKCDLNSRKNYRDIILKYFENGGNADLTTQFYLLQSVKYIPFINLGDKKLDSLFSFIIEMLESEDIDLRLAALDRTYNLLYRIKKDSPFIKELKELFISNAKYSEVPAENFLKFKIVSKLKLDKEHLEKYAGFFNNDKTKTSDIFLKNLKSATNWVNKKIHIELLLEEIFDNPKQNSLHTAMHFCNLIKVSAKENVRNHAGEALLKIFPLLPMDQRNDVTIELLRALEIQGYHFTKYIPDYLGQLILYLHPTELDELVYDFIEKIKHSNTQINLLLFKTVGVALKNYPKYLSFFKEDDKVYKERQIKMLGILLNGLVHYDDQVKQEAFRIIGTEIFGCQELNLNEKCNIFTLIAKKLLTLLPDKKESQLLFLNNAASLNHIYSFISDYNFFKGDITIRSHEKIAFFPGTFDPFTLGHKEITKAIRDLGFEVYLAVDEFSWSKLTQPHNLRRKIIDMSIANELDIHLYPQDIQVNIANPRDLKALRESFPDSDVYIVVGSDVVLNASGYKNKGSDNSIHTFSHIIFERKTSLYSEKQDESFNESLKKIKGEKIILSLPPQYEDISSTQIRNYIDENRDISQLIDPMAQNYIYEYGIYRREPQYKSLIQTKSLDIEIVDEVDDLLIDEIYNSFFMGNDRSLYNLLELKSKLSPRVLIIRDINNNGSIVGFSAFHWIRSSMLFNQFKDNNISEYIRENAVGRIILIDGIFVKENSKFANLEQIILTETLAFCLAKDYTYGVFKNMINNKTTKALKEVLKLQGFIELPYGNLDNPTYVVGMTNPCTLNLDLESVIKEPFKSNPKVKKSIVRSRKRLQRVLTKLYPGHLIIPFDRDILYERLMEKICDINNVSTQHKVPRALGEKMCVPFGSILNGNILPNTVTKSMHTEKMFNPDIKGFNIGPFPNYMTLTNQIKMINSFDRKVILVDDLLNKGYRIKAIDPILKKENLNVEKIVVGILSGRGKELMDIQGRDVDSAYFIPNLKVWFSENSLYPFIGGDTVWRGNFPKRNLLPSVNFILPYASPTFIKGTSNASVYELSQVCINNSIDIISTLEREYRILHERNLTLQHLGEVFTSPRCPDHGKNLDYDLNLRPSEYLKNDLENLKRIEDIIRR